VKCSLFDFCLFLFLKNPFKAIVIKKKKKKRKIAIQQQTHTLPSNLR